MGAPRRGWQSLIRDDPFREGDDSRLFEMIHFGKADVTCKVQILSLPIFIKEDPAFWWQPVLCQFSSKTIQLLDGKICHYAKDYGLVQDEGLSCPVSFAWK